MRNNEGHEDDEVAELLVRLINISNRLARTPPTRPGSAPRPRPGVR
ncbi:hypothetical protein HFP72_02975 [Nocardiopsis sp. ARC36]